MKTKVVSREFFEGQVQKAMAKIPIGTIYIAGARKIKDYGGTYRVLLDIVQKKDMKAAGETSSSGNPRSIRVWTYMSIEGYEKIFTQIAVYHSGAELHKQVGELKDEEVLSMFVPFDEVSLPSGELVKPCIEVRQYSDVNSDTFPQSISKILSTEESSRTQKQKDDLKKLSMYNIEGDPLVDSFGHQVYELNEFTYGEEVNIIINKIPLSQYSNYILDMKNSLSASDQLEICKYLSKNQAFSWTSAIIERYSDKWDWDALSKNTSIPWTLQLINKYADKLSCSKLIWNTLKPYIDDELIEETFKEINKI